jgi:hypothetical protein
MLKKKNRGRTKNIDGFYTKTTQKNIAVITRCSGKSGTAADL